jgi:hypothetical protein
MNREKSKNIIRVLAGRRREGYCYKKEREVDGRKG